LQQCGKKRRKAKKWSGVIKVAQLTPSCPSPSPPSPSLGTDS